jgi:uncharacterized coiled-coil protein SlyX
MNLKNTLFVAGLCFFLGCNNENNSQASELRMRLDSTINANAKVVDSLNQQLQKADSELAELQLQSNLLRDSLEVLKESLSDPSPNSRKGPWVNLKPQGVPTILPKRHLGDPVRDTNPK